MLNLRKKLWFALNFIFQYTFYKC